MISELTGAHHLPNRFCVSQGIKIRPGHESQRQCWRQRVAIRAFQSHMDCVAFTLIVDDLVFADGTTSMANLGGGGSQTLWGYQLYRNQGASVSLAAGVGPDLPSSCLQWLQSIGVDVTGLIPVEQSTPRAWQVLETDGRRTQVWRTPATPQLDAMLLPSFMDLPAHLQKSCCYHLGIHPNHPPLHLLSQLQQAAHAQGGLVSVEPFTHADAQPSQRELEATLQLCDIFSPNELEAASIVGPGSPAQLCQRFLDYGAAVVALRRGPHGAMVKAAGGMETWRIPAVQGIHVVDVTGCGNAFCGGFLAAYQAGESLADAGLWGCVAASFLAEHQGIIQIAPHHARDEAMLRLQATKPFLEPL